MISVENLYKTYFEAFLTENLDLPLTKILKLMNVDRSTFYYHFNYYEDFVEKAFDNYFEELRKERTRLNGCNLFEIIQKINTEIIKTIKSSKKPINFENFYNNIQLFYDILKKRYKLLVLNEFINKYFLYKNKKMNCDIVLEEAFFSLLIHIKNKEINFSDFYLISK